MGDPYISHFLPQKVFSCIFPKILWFFCLVLRLLTLLILWLHIQAEQADLSFISGNTSFKVKPKQLVECGDSKLINLVVPLLQSVQWWSNERIIYFKLKMVKCSLMMVKRSSMMVKWVYGHKLISPSLTSISASLTGILPSLAWSKPTLAYLTIIEKLNV